MEMRRLRRRRHVRQSLASIFDIRHLIEAFRVLNFYNGNKMISTWPTKTGNR